MPIMAAFTIPILLAEVRGYSQLYDNWDDYGLPYYILSLFLFLVFTDFGTHSPPVSCVSAASSLWCACAVRMHNFIFFF